MAPQSDSLFEASGCIAEREGERERVRESGGAYRGVQERGGEAQKARCGREGLSCVGSSSSSSSSSSKIVTEGLKGKRSFMRKR